MGAREWIAGAQSLADSLNALVSRRFAGQQGALERESSMARLVEEMKHRESMMLLADQLQQETEKREDIRAGGEREAQMSAFEAMFGAPPVSGYDLTEQPGYAGGPGFTGGAPPPGGGAFYEELSPGVQQFMGGFGELPAEVQPYAAEYMQPFMMEDIERGRTETRLSGITDIMNRMLSDEFLAEVGITGDLGFEELMYLRDLSPELFDVQTTMDRITDEFERKMTLTSMAGVFHDRGSSNEDIAQFYTSQGLEMTPDQVQQMIDARDSLRAAELELSGVYTGDGVKVGDALSREDAFRIYSQMAPGAQEQLAQTAGFVGMDPIEYLMTTGGQVEFAPEAPAEYDYEAQVTEAREYREEMPPTLKEAASYDELHQYVVQPRISQIQDAEDADVARDLVSDGVGVVRGLQGVADSMKDRLIEELQEAFRAKWGIY